MLFLLTGDVQTGKTRWLQARVAELARAGVTVYGVLAPGVWRERAAGARERRYEKLGIQNILLPQRRTVDFAVRRDLLGGRGGTAAGGSQASRAGLSWEISDAALERVNAHFRGLGPLAGTPGRGLLVVDELGPLELRRGGGLSEALALLERGPAPAWRDALAVVRAGLLEEARERLGGAWGRVATVRPDEAGREELLAAARPD